MSVEINEVVVGHKSLRQSLTERGWYIRYIRDIDTVGMSGDNEITIVYKVVTKFGGDVINYFYSVCSEEDNFSKDIGVMVALEKEEYAVVSKGGDVETEVLEHILSNEKRSSVKDKICEYLLRKRAKELRKAYGDGFPHYRVV